MSTSSLVLVPVPNNDFLFRRPSLKSSSCFIISHSSFQFSPPQALSSQRLSFRIFSLSTEQPQGTTAPLTTTTTKTARKSVAIYLMEKLGFSEQLSMSISKKLLHLRDYRHVKQVTDLISFENADNVIAFLQQHCGLDLSHINKLITKYPSILGADVDKTIRPKIKILQDLGISISDLAHVLSRNPALYLKTDLTLVIQALRGIVGSDEDVVRVFMRLSYGTASNYATNLFPNLNMLENEYGIPRDKLIAFLTTTPKSLVRNTESLRDLLVKLEDKWGITRDSTEFLRAVDVFSGHCDENINSKCQVFRSYGWSDSDILSLIRRLPTSLGHSEAGIKKKLEFLVNELGYEPAYLASQPVLFGCSLENRVVPRHKILRILKEKGLIKADYKLDTAIRLTANKFFDRFIRPFKNEVPQLLEVYINCAGSAPTEELKHLETSGNERSTLVALE